MSFRKEPRLSKKIMVGFGVDGYEHMGLVENLSPHGMFIKTPELFDTGSRFKISVAAYHRIFTFDGKVAWNSKSEKNAGMGIHIDSVPAPFRHLINKQRL